MRTWRGKLVLWSLASMFAVALVFAGVTYANLRKSLLEEERRELDVRTEALVRVLRENPSLLRSLSSPRDEERRATEQAWEIRLRAFLYPDERLSLFGEGGAVLLHIEGDGEEGNVEGDDAPFANLTLYREFSSGGTTYVLRVDHPSTRLKTLTHLLLRSLLVGLVVAAAGSTAGALLLARAFLRPLHALLQTFRRVREADFSARAPVGAADDELAELARTFNAMMDAVEASVARERRFFADAAHELRTPLAAISGHAEFLRRWGDRDPERAKRSLEAIREETARLTRLVEGILTLGRLEDPDALLALEGSCWAEEVLLPLVEEYRLLYPHVEVSFSSADRSPCVSPAMARSLPQEPLPPHVFPLACESLRHLARILLDNAVKYGAKGGEGGKVVVGVFVAEDGAGFFVRDYGPGIPERDLPHVFERFYRGDPARRRGGYGLGLSIARAIVERTGGEIRLANLPDGGLCALVRWPSPA
ncbi:sensor histidine kinase [Brockia lithotrophica]|uniref:histidine kinase n=1 Tax=Brockia lithotrophica TaxID=933949 RepID=A0A660L7N6_9BACL|nr:HAMP domain-containing sensor histidine kinase [Brockia lithotrophica]RKQ88869.1 signal transduction histidine kinase [Brockia lithotrophica]